MAFASGPTARTATGPELPDVSVNNIGFKSIGGEVKLKLPIQWSTDSPPPTSSSLLSIASSKGLLAAVGPEALILASTDRIRAAFKDVKSKSETIQFEPDVVIPTPRLSHVAFTSDSSCLILAAETGGGLAAHSVDALLKKQTNPAFELPTEGVAVKAVVPNPAPESAHLVAVLMANGHLMIANFQDQKFAQGPNGASIRSNVTSVAWSVRGKQLVAGLENGSAVQIDPAGAVKAEIPSPPDMDAGHFMSSIVWLGNDDFLTIHSPSSPMADSPPESVFRWVRTDKGRTQFEFRKAPNEPCWPLLNRVPASYFVSRIRKWSSLEDALILTSVASSDIGLLTNSTSPLSTEANAADITNVYTLTTLDEARRATLPMSTGGSMDDTYPIGQALDLSSKDKVYQPIPGDDTITGESLYPLPALTVLNYEGILSYYWFVFDNALRGEGGPYPGLVAAEGTAAATVASPNASTSPTFTRQTPGFGSPGFCATAQPAFASSALPKPSQPGFGASAFGKPAAPAAFGGPSALGSSSPWTSAGPKAAVPTFGQLGLGASSAPASSTGFGATGNLGQKPSLWGTQPASSAGESKSAPFGGNTSTQSGFAKLGSSTTSGSPFGSIGASNTTAAPFGGMKSNTASAFTSPGMKAPFGSTTSTGSNFGGSTLGTKSVFGTMSFPSSNQTPSLFGQTSSLATTSSEKINDQDMEDDMQPESTPTPQAATPAASGLFGTKAPFKVDSSFKPGETAKEKGEVDEPSSKGPFSFGLGSLGTGLGSKTPEIKPDPDLPKKSLFDIPSITSKQIQQTTSPEDTPSSDSAKTVVPAPPQVTSKPIPSPATGSSSGSQSVKSYTQEQPSIEDPPEIVQHPESSSPVEPEEAEEEDEVASEEDEEDGEADEESESEEGEDTSEVITTPEREEKNLESSPASGQTSSPMPSELWSRGKVMPASNPLRPFPGLRSSTTPAGMPGPVFSFPPPQKQDSPRSPSPVRAPMSGAPPSISQPLQATGIPQPSTLSRGSTPRAPEASEPPVKKQTETISDLRDDDEYIRTLLAQPIQPTLELESFYTHHDYVANVQQEGVVGQITRVYRDINSMIDTLGRNARSLSSFVAGHAELSAETPGDPSELDDDDRKWTLDEIERLQSIQKSLEQTLTSEHADAILENLPHIASLKRDLRHTKEDAKKQRAFLQSHKDPLQQSKRRNAPLDPNATAVQRGLQLQLATFKRALAEAEDKVTQAKAGLATRSSSGRQQMPTVEAVEKTIRKMTGMVERRSGDVAVLEMQMRKLGVSGTASESLTGSLRNGNSPAKGRSFGSYGVGEWGEEEDEAEAEARMLRIVRVRRRRRAILERVREGCEARREDVVLSVES